MATQFISTQANECASKQAQQICYQEQGSGVGHNMSDFDVLCGCPCIRNNDKCEQ